MRRLATVMTIGVLAAALAVWAVPGDPPSRPPPPPPPGMEIAVQDDAAFVSRDGGDVERLYVRARQLGATRQRILVNWHQAVASRRGQRVRYDWAPYDAAVNTARRHGLRVQITLTGTPSFVPGGDHYLSYRSPRPRRLARFARAAAGHFRGRVDRYAVWNEPNSAVFLSPGGGCRSRTCTGAAGRLYRDLYLAGHGAIRSQDPRAEVLMGETAANAVRGRVVAPLAFLREVVCRRPDLSPSRPCPALTTDGYAHHPYQFRDAPGAVVPESADEVGLSSLPRLHAALSALREAGALATPDGETPPVHVTEFGYFKAGTRRGAQPEAVRARWLPQAFELADRYGFVRQMTYYHLVETRPKVAWNSGIVRRGGAETPAFSALRAWASARGRTSAGLDAPLSR